MKHLEDGSDQHGNDGGGVVAGSSSLLLDTNDINDHLRVSLELCARDVELVAGFGDRDVVVWIGLAGGVGRDLFRWLCAVACGTTCSRDHWAEAKVPHPRD